MLKKAKIMKYDSGREKQIEAQLLVSLKEVPFLGIAPVRRRPNGKGWQPDILLQVKEGTSAKTIVVEVKASGQPRLARDAVNQLLVYLKGSEKTAYGIFAAPYISEQAAQICAQNGIGYIDLAGNCLINFGRVFIKREGKSNPFAEKRDLRSLYSPRSERVLRALLNGAKRVWKIQELAKTAGVSLGQAFNVKKLLLDREWIAASEAGFSLVQPEALLREWSENYDFRRNKVIEYYSMSSIPEIEAALAELAAGSTKDRKITYSLTGFSGAARLGAASRYQRVMAYVNGDDVDEVEKKLGLKRVSSGANVMLMVPYDEGVYQNAQAVDGDRIVSPVQDYLDLIGYRGRGEETAEVILNEKLRRTWA